MIYWLKTKSDIDNFGYNYDEHSYSLDSNALELKLDPPMRQYEVKKIIGTGVSIAGGDTFGQRVITFSRVFKQDKISQTGALTQERINFLNKYILSRDEIYLVRNYNNAIQYIRVYPTLKGENYKKLNISENVGIELICSDPFFKDLTETEISFVKDSRIYFKAFNNDGAPTPGVFEGTFVSGDGNIKIIVYENIGCELIHEFAPNDTLKIDFGTFRIWLNGVERFNVNLIGSPFDILSGANNLGISCASNLDNCKLIYRGRHL